MDALKKFISRKLFVAILTPILSAVVMSVNAHLPTPLAPEQVQAVVSWLVALAIAFIIGQSAVDVANSKK